ncbi:hypothetical protein D3Z47_17220 [Lachnospiraceae bacterium]|nr:hypothetical protein [Lachnospiraceae bacterium]
MKENKTCMIQARCTVEEVKKIDKVAEKCGIKRSDYIRMMLCHNEKGKSLILEKVRLVVAVQEILNYLTQNYPSEDKILERKVDAIWKML